MRTPRCGLMSQFFEGGTFGPERVCRGGPDQQSTTFETQQKTQTFRISLDSICYLHGHAQIVLFAFPEAVKF